VAVYAGVPAANAAFAVAKKEFDEAANVSTAEEETAKARQEDA